MPVAWGAGLYLGMQWYYAIGGERFGPVTHSELERLVQAGTIVADTLIWRQGMNEWQTLAAVRAVNPAWIAERRLATPPALETPEEDIAPHLSVPDLTGHTSEPEALVYAGFWPRFGAYLVIFSSGGWSGRFLSGSWAPCISPRPWLLPSTVRATSPSLKS